jgi:hypothetical protein
MKYYAQRRRKERNDQKRKQKISIAYLKINIPSIKQLFNEIKKLSIHVNIRY